MEFIGSKDDAGYLYDVYENNEYLMKGLNQSFVMSLSKSIKLIKLLEYIPEEWNVDQILATKVQDLTFLQLKRLEVVRRDLSIAHAIKEKLRSKNYNEQLYDYATKIDMNKIINYKFDVDALKEKYVHVFELSNEEKLEIIDAYKNKFNISLQHEVVLYLIEQSINYKTKIQ